MGSTYKSADVLNGIKNASMQTQHDEGYQQQIQNNYTQLFNTVNKQNDIIHSTYYDYVNLNSADAQQSKYVYQSSSILASIYTYGFYIYMVVAAILCGVIVMKPLTIFYKIVLVIVILTYPYYIYPLEEWCYILSTYIWGLLTSSVYSNGYSNTSLEYGMEGGGNISNSHANNGETNNQANQQTNEQTNGAENGSGPTSSPPPPLYVPPTLPPPPMPEPLPQISFS